MNVETGCLKHRDGTAVMGKEGGWVHSRTEQKKTHQFIVTLRKASTPVMVDCASMFQAWQSRTEPKQLMAFCEALGVEPMAMHMIGCVWAAEHAAWAMAMRDVAGKIVGIRLRSENGRKWSVTGSKAGLFFPVDYTPKAPLLIVEGATDCAAALSIGYSAIGRQSCVGQHDLVNDYIEMNKIKEVVIVSDKDQAKIRPDGTAFYPGQEGSERLQNALKVRSLRLVLPCKDLREFVRAGGNKAMMQGFISARVWKNP